VPFVRYGGAVTTFDEATGTAVTPVTVPPATRTEDLVTALCGAAMMLGVMADSWAHTNLLGQIQREGFFTPWHGLLYSGFAATAVWTFRIAYRRRDVAAEWWRDGWPAGYRAGAIGTVIFLLSGGADMAWHTFLGIEADIAALLSPSHIGLAVGSTLLLSSPLRSWWARGAGRDGAVAGVLSLALSTVPASIFLFYVSPFFPALALRAYHTTATGDEYDAAARGLASYVVTTAVLVVPLLLAHRRRYTFGVATAVTAVVAAFAVVPREFPHPQSIASLAAVAGAAVVDGLLFWLDRRRGIEAPLRLVYAGAVLPAVVWSAHLLALQLASGVHWPPELWGGTIVVSAAAGALLGGLAARPAPAEVLAGS
jgi:hypothetical protein